MSITNAIVHGFRVGFEGHGLLTIDMTVACGGNAFQGFGGFNLGRNRLDQPEKCLGPDYAADFIIGCLLVCGASSIDEMAGKAIRVERNDGGRITGIGHIVDDIWYRPSERFAAMSAAANGGAK